MHLTADVEEFFRKRIQPLRQAPSRLGFKLEIRSRPGLVPDYSQFFRQIIAIMGIEEESTRWILLAVSRDVRHDRAFAYRPCLIDTEPPSFKQRRIDHADALSDKR